ncbi:MAG TPA: hypothetical protein VGA66_10350 [Mycobacterium sp.]
MDDSPTTLLEAVVSFIMAGGLILAARAMFASSTLPRRIAAGIAAHAARQPAPDRRHVTVADDPCDHDFTDLRLDDLLPHVYDKHFEVWNLLGDTQAMPAKWRAEHAADHGMEKMR